MQLQRLKSTELYEVKFDHQGCEVEICFFSVNNTNFNMILTGGYHNPTATNRMFLKMMNAANNHSSMESIGFIGFLTTDDITTVKECIEICFQKLKNRVKFIEQQMKEINAIEAMIPGEIIGEIVYKYFNNEVKAANAKSPPQSFSSRFSRTRKPKEQIVDLTDVDEEMPNVNNIDIPDELFYDVCCSDVSDIDPLFGHFAGEKKNKLNEEVNRWCLESDFGMYPDDHEKCPPLKKLQEKLKDLLKETQKHELNEFKFMKEHNVSMSYDENPSEHPSTSQYNIQFLNRTDAVKYYENKATEDRGSIKDTRRTLSPQLGRNWDHSLRLNFDTKTKNKRILDPEDYQKIEEDKRNKKQKQRFSDPKLPKFPGFTIPKKVPSPEKGFSPSVVSTSPSIYARKPIHDAIKNSSKIQQSDRNVKMLSTFLTGPPKCEPSPDGYMRISRESDRSSLEVVKSLADKVETIVLDKDDENENSDMNNNGQRPRKIFHDFETPKETPKKNKIFTTKKPSKPDFQAKRNGGCQ